MVFFAIWWAWLNFSWLSSAYDPNDGLSWIVTTLLILGACVLAAGVPRAMSEQDFTVITVGYAVMRLPLVTGWCRAAVGDRSRRATCLRFAAGLIVVQAGWLARLSLPTSWSLSAFVLLVAAELAVASWARRPADIPTNPGHLAGRYARFTLTVAAQVVAAVVYAIQTGISRDTASTPLMVIAVVSLAAVLCLMWLYYALPHAELAASRCAKLWEYGHYVIVGAIGGIGAGARFLAETTAGHGQGQADGLERWAAYPMVTAIAVSVATLWLVCVLPAQQYSAAWARARYPLCVLLIVLVAAVAPGPIWTVGIVVLLLLVLSATEGRARPADPAPPRAGP